MAKDPVDYSNKDAKDIEQTEDEEISKETISVDEAVNERNLGKLHDDPNEDDDPKTQEETTIALDLDSDNIKAEDDAVNRNIVEENVQLEGIKV